MRDDEPVDLLEEIDNMLAEAGSSQDISQIRKIIVDTRIMIEEFLDIYDQVHGKYEDDCYE